MIPVQYPEISTPNFIGESEKEDPPFGDGTWCSGYERYPARVDKFLREDSFEGLRLDILHNNISFNPRFILYTATCGECVVSPVLYTDEQSVVRSVITGHVSFDYYFNEPFLNGLLKEGFCSGEASSPAYAVLNVKRIDDSFATIKYETEITGFRLEYYAVVSYYYAEAHCGTSSISYKTRDSTTWTEIKGEEWLRDDIEHNTGLRWHNISDYYAYNYGDCGKTMFQPRIYRVRNAGATVHHKNLYDFSPDNNWEMYD